LIVQPVRKMNTGMYVFLHGVRCIFSQVGFGCLVEIG